MKKTNNDPGPVDISTDVPFVPLSFSHLSKEQCIIYSKLAADDINTLMGLRAIIAEYNENNTVISKSVYDIITETILGIIKRYGIKASSEAFPEYNKDTVKNITDNLYISLKQTATLIDEALSTINDTIKEKTKRNTVNMAFSLLGFDNIIFNIKLNKTTINPEIEDNASVKIDVKIKDNTVIYKNFSLAIEKLKSLLDSYQPKLQKILKQNLGEGKDYFLVYSQDYMVNGDKLSLNLTMNGLGLIDIDKIYLNVPNVNRYENGRWAISMDLLINSIFSFLKHSSDIIIQG